MKWRRSRNAVRRRSTRSRAVCSPAVPARVGGGAPAHRPRPGPELLVDLGGEPLEPAPVLRPFSGRHVHRGVYSRRRPEAHRPRVRVGRRTRGFRGLHRPHVLAAGRNGRRWRFQVEGAGDRQGPRRAARPGPLSEGNAMQKTILAGLAALLAAGCAATPKSPTRATPCSTAPRRRPPRRSPAPAAEPPAAKASPDDAASKAESCGLVRVAFAFDSASSTRRR